MMKTFTQVLLLVALCFVAPTVQAQYCLLPGRTIYSANQPGITNFKLGTIDRTSSNVEKPLSQPSMVVTSESTDLERGKTYTIEITHSKDAVVFPTARNNVRVWLDYNGNKDFTDAGETIISKDFVQSGSTFTGTFTVPMTAPLGTTRLRATAKMSSDAGHTIPTPCDLPKDPIDYHGEMEDYDVTIIDPPPTTITNIHNAELTTKLYPNPTTGQVTIALNGNKENVSIELYDVTGKMIGNINQSPASSYTIDLNDYTTATGVYYLKVIAAGSYTYNRVVKIN